MNVAVAGVSLAAACAIVVQYIAREVRSRKDGKLSPLSWTLLPQPACKSGLFGMAGDFVSAGKDAVRLLEEWAEACGEEPPWDPSNKKERSLCVF